MSALQQVLMSLKSASGAPAGSMQVAGAGTSEANGTYMLTGTSDGKNYYNKSGTSTEISVLKWDGDSWEIYGPAGQKLYGSASNVATPDLASGWYVYTADAVAPVPTVTMN